ncbi:SUMF1/EgtB/PvdO family nonheme iron enzyme [Luteolibacter sp. AS25]|uniref:SUMF1/EgtB/PvdO family nonheme iron enzyme n=1 Tax=Luteolibacter sp. AS25 TaxID=3135776 RepID=UPI00398A9BA7
MTDVIDDNRFGDYRAKELLGEGTTTRTWAAEQVSVGRMVLLEELKESAAGERAYFLADVRAKAAVEHPLVGSIYEAFTEGELCFYTEELLPGKTLEKRLEEGETFDPPNFVHILRCIAEANEYHEAHGTGTSSFDSGSVFVDDQGVVRIKNLAVAGGRIPDHSLRDILKLGSELEPMLKLNRPGGTRCLTLLSWMRGEGVPKPLEWNEIRDYCEQIEQQLTEPSGMEAPPTAAIRPMKGKRNNILFAGGAVLFLALLAFFLTSKGKKEQVAGVREASWVAVEGGLFISEGGLRFRTGPFEISSTEVTIGEYAQFLEALEIVEEENRTIYDHGEQPTVKAGHKPDDWKMLYETAQKKGIWGEHEVTIDSPVVGVDWWDAYAYAKWKKGFLPNLEQWMAALLAKTKAPSKIPVSDWLPVSENDLDRTTDGLLGLAGSVAEWTSEPRPNPSNPLGESLWVIAGGSYLQPAEGANTRGWVNDRSMRRPDLGFRICREAE